MITRGTITGRAKAVLPAASLVQPVRPSRDGLSVFSVDYHQVERRVLEWFGSRNLRHAQDDVMRKTGGRSTDTGPCT